MDQLDDFVALGQVPIGGELDLVVLGVFDHVILIDHDQACQEFSSISDDHGVIDIGAEFQLVFNILRGNIFTSGCDNNILFPIRDLQISVLIKFAHIPGVKPSILYSLCRAFRVIKISLKNAWGSY